MCVVDVKECVQTCKRTGHKLPLSVAEEARGNYDNNGVRNTSPGNTRERLTNGCEEIEDRVSKEDPDISPPVVVADVEARHKEVVGRAHAAVVAVRGGVGVRQVSTSHGNEGVQVRAAGHTTGRLDLNKLDRRTSDRLSTNGLTKETFDQVGERRKSIPGEQRQTRCGNPT